MWGVTGSIFSLLCCYLSEYFPELFYTIPDRSDHNKLPILHLELLPCLFVSKVKHITRASSNSHQVLCLRLTSISSEMPKNMNLSLSLFFFLQYSQSGSRISFLEYHIPWNRNGQEVSLLEVSPSVSLWKQIHMSYVTIYRLLRKYHDQKIILQEREPVVSHTCTPCNIGKLIT